MAHFRIRPATEADLEAVARIHTYYIENTVISLTTHPRPLAEYLEKFRDITSRGLPYLVAQTNPDEAIAGFVNAHLFRGGTGAYATTAELTVFCDPAFVGKGLGRRLVAAVVAVLKDRRANEQLVLDEHLATDPGIAQLLAVMSVDPEGGARLRRFYEENGFTLVGHLRRVGCKFGKWIDTMYLQMSLDGGPVV